MWKIIANDGATNVEGIENVPFFTPEYSISDCVVYVERLMKVTENSILCLQRNIFGNNSTIEQCDIKYQNMLSSYANACIYKIVSIVRSIVIWNLPNSNTNRLGPWHEEYMPLTRFILKNNVRLLFCLLAVTTTSPFRIDRVPCFSRYIGIRSLIVWEMKSRALSLYDWTKVLRNGGLFRLIEVKILLWLFCLFFLYMTSLYLLFNSFG